MSLQAQLSWVSSVRVEREALAAKIKKKKKIHLITLRRARGMVLDARKKERREEERREKNK